MSAAAAGRAPIAPRVGAVDVRGRSPSSGRAQVPLRSPSSSRPRSRSATASRSGPSSPRARSRRPAGWALERLDAGQAGAIGFREGFLVVALTWLLARGLRRAAVPPLAASRSSTARVDALFEAMSGFTTTGASVVTDIDGARPLAAVLAPVQPLARRHGDHRPRARRPAAAPDRRPPAAGVRAPGPGDRASSATSIRDTARRLWLLYVGADGAADRSSSPRSAGLGSTSG